MLTDSYDVIYFITNAFNIPILYKFMGAFFEKPVSSKPICTLSYLSHFLITSMVYLFVDVPFLTLFVNFAIFFIITLNYHSSIQRKLLISFYTLLFMSVTEIIVSTCTGYFHFSFFTEGNYKNSVGVIAARLITYMMALLFKNFKMSQNNQKVTRLEWFASLFIPITTLILEILIIHANNISQTEVLLSLATVFLLNLLAFYLYDSLTKSYGKLATVAVLEKENELYSKQCEIMQTSTEDLQSFRHDLNNQFIVISELLENKQYEMAKAQISTLSQRTRSSVIYSTTGNTVIDGLINYKLQCAANENITVNSEIAVPTDLEIETTDIVTILGNLLDNAIRALRELNSDERSLSVKVVYSQGRLIIQMINPYLAEVEYLNGEIVSTQIDKRNHGFGIKNIENVVEKYDGYMEINHENSVFRVDILLYLPRG